MIDWITAVIPCEHALPIQDGCFQRVGSDGRVEWTSASRLSVEGSFSTSVTMRSASWVGDGLSHIELSGNLVKFFQGHNLWGSDDLHGLVVEFVRWLVEEQRGKDAPLVCPTAEDVRAIKAGEYSLHRVDITDSFVLSSRFDVLAWLRAAEQTAYLSHRGRGQLVKGSTLYFGKGSRRWSLKLYSKGQEIEENFSKQPALMNLPNVRAWADNVLRAELTIRGMELRRFQIDQGSSWKHEDGVPFDPLYMLRAKLQGMTMTTTRTLSEEVLATLTTSQRLAYSAWLSGEDLRGILSNGAFYNLRNKLLPHGVDVATLQLKEGTNVVPLVRVLEAKPASIPEWAHGTHLYYEPRRIA